MGRNSEMSDNTIQCSKCGKMISGLSKFCPACGTSTQGVTADSSSIGHGQTDTLSLAAGNHKVSLISGAILYQYHIDETSVDHTKQIGLVRSKQDDPSDIGIKNISDTVWYVKRPGEEMKSVAPGATVKIVTGTSITIGAFRAEVLAEQALPVPSPQPQASQYVPVENNQIAAAANTVQAVNEEHAAWLRFCRTVYDDCIQNGTYTGTEVPTMFPPYFAADEKRIAKIPFVLYVYSGLEVVNNFNPVAAAHYTAENPLFGAAYMIGARHARKKAEAQAQAQPQWREDDHGELLITQHGFYMMPVVHAKTVPFSFESINLMQATAWNSIEMELDPGLHSDLGRFAVTTPAASLIFMLWCLYMYPEHPQFAGVLGFKA